MKAWFFAVFHVALVLLAAVPAAASEAENMKVEVDYEQGFLLRTTDGRFQLRLNGALGFRYTYVDYDEAVVGNEDDFSNFLIRRARLYFRGHAFDERFTYFVHLQLEPHRSAGSHDLWLEYDFGDLLQLGAGRNKIAYGLEFLNSGLAGNLVERSIFSGMSDLDVGGGGPQYPGGGTGEFRLNAAADTGFATGGLSLYRSQGVQARGRRGGDTGPTFEYQAGVWQGRGTSGLSNRTDDHLFSLRVGIHPWGWVDWRRQGDGGGSEHFKAGFLASVYTNSSDLGGGYSEHGVDLAVVARWRGFSADAEVARETFDYDQFAEDFNRFGWRVQIGWFVVPETVEIAGRYAFIERLDDPTRERAVASGLGVAELHGAEGSIVGIERAMREVTVGASYFINEWHRHKLQFDLSRVERCFAADPVAGIERAPDQVDLMARVAVQLVF